MQLIMNTFDRCIAKHSFDILPCSQSANPVFHYTYINNNLLSVQGTHILDKTYYCDMFNSLLRCLQCVDLSLKYALLLYGCNIHFIIKKFYISTTTLFSVKLNENMKFTYKKKKINKREEKNQNMTRILSGSFFIMLLANNLKMRVWWWIDVNVVSTKMPIVQFGDNNYYLRGQMYVVEACRNGGLNSRKELWMNSLFWKCTIIM